MSCPKKSLTLLPLFFILFATVSDATQAQERDRSRQARHRIAERSVGGWEDVVRRSYDARIAASLLTNSLFRAFYLPQTQPPPAPLPSRPLSLPENRRPAPAPQIDPETLSRIAPFDPHILQHSRGFGIDPNLTRAIIYVESGGDPRAVSPKGARGLMQLMPDTADQLGVRNVFDPAQNIRGGARYLRTLLDQFHNVELALWGYNAGPGAVERRSLPAETRRYIPEVLRVKAALDRLDPAPVKAARMTEKK
jgi:soluble lytic murein transglycosylase-like protein